jgi:hypothetical protein
MTINEQLRTAIGDSGDTHYRIGKETGIAPSVLDRFLSRATDHLTGRNIDKVCEYFGLELCKTRQRTGGKQAGKKQPTKRKQAAKK